MRKDLELRSQKDRDEYLLAQIAAELNMEGFTADEVSEEFMLQEPSKDAFGVKASKKPEPAAKVLKRLCKRGWIEEANVPGEYRITEAGRGAADA